MNARAARRYALFLVLLVLGQEFSLARYNPDESLLAKRLDDETRDSIVDDIVHNDDNNKQDPDYRPDQESNNSDDELEDENSEEEEDEKETTALQVAQPQKRNAFALVIMGIQIGFSLASLTTEILYKIDKCCGNLKLHPNVCTYRDQIKASEKRIKAIGVQTDKVALEAVNLKEDVILTNYQLNDVWNAMKEIQTYEEELVQILVPSITKQFNSKWLSIERELEKMNATVQRYTYDKLNSEYQSVFDNFESTMMSMITWFGYGLMFAAMKAFSVYKQNQINKLVDAMSTGEGYKQLVIARHTKSAKIMGVNKVGLNTYIRNHATSKVNAKYSSSGVKWTVAGLSAAGAGVSAAFDVLAIIAKVQQCKDIEANLLKGRNTMFDYEKKFGELLTNATNYRDYVKKDGWGFITKQVTSASFQKAIDDIKGLVVNAQTKTPALRTSIVNMNLFLTKINQTVNTNTNKTWYLVKNLATGLQAVKFKMACYVNRGRLIRHILSQCKNGTGHLRDLYNSGVNSFGTHGDKCIINDKGTPYTNFASVEVSVKNVSKAENFSADCILNNGNRLTQACGFKKDGYTEQEIADKKMPDLNVDQVKYFLARCPPPELTPKQKTQICKFKKKKWTALEIAEFIEEDGITEQVVQNYMDTGCP